MEPHLPGLKEKDDGTTIFVRPFPRAAPLLCVLELKFAFFRKKTSGAVWKEERQG